MKMRRERFERLTDDKDYIKPDIVNVRLNYEERLMLEALKKYYKEKNDSTALKKEAFKVLKQNLIFNEKNV